MLEEKGRRVLRGQRSVEEGARPSHADAHILDRVRDVILESIQYNSAVCIRFKFNFSDSYHISLIEKTLEFDEDLARTGALCSKDVVK